MIEVVASIALVCSPLTREEGRELVLLAPAVVTAAAAAGTEPSVQFKRIEAGTFVYRVSSVGGRLIGWYAVDELTGLVRDWITDGFPAVTTPAMADLQRQLHFQRCRLR